MDELAEIFADLGFSVATGPEIEDDWHNFTALNIPESHPARAMHDTFYFDRTRRRRPSDAAAHPHLAGADPDDAERSRRRSTSSRPGRTYRSDSDATHTPMFHQIEGLVIDRGITLGHLKWTLETFLKAFFERDDIVLQAAPVLFPVHRAFGRGRRRLPPGEGPARARRLRPLDGAARLAAWSIPG